MRLFSKYHFLKGSIFCGLALVFSGLLNAQKPLESTDLFDAPLEIPLYLSGNFGELRSNHFHSGLDIKTQQSTGIAVKTSARGFVSRIKIQHGGYGKALYIQHPSGHTSVYAHLDRYAGKIEAYVKKHQYARTTYEIELFPEPDELVVERDELVAFSGNTGSSGGPHLHYEIRNSSQEPLNPLAFNFNIKDNKPPYVRDIYVYTLNKTSCVNNQQGRIGVRLTKNADGVLRSEPLKVIGEVGFGIIAYDQQNTSNLNGVYRIDTSINGTELYSITMDKFSFNETRYINHQIDYAYFKKNKRRILKLFIDEFNPLSMQQANAFDGKIIIEESKDYVYRIVLKDFAGNTSEVEIPLQYDNNQKAPEYTENTELFYIEKGLASSHKLGPWQIEIPAHTLYKNAYLDFQHTQNSIKLHADTIPLHKNISVIYDLSNYKIDDRSKLYLARHLYKDFTAYTDSYIQDNKLIAKTRLFGDYALAIDSISPSIKPVNFRDKQWISKLDKLELEIEDKESGIEAYRATVNGDFILMEYDYKTNRLTHYFSDKVVTETENHLSVNVVDKTGNSTTFEAVFFRKP
ncbi:MAG: M23 family metallopeptidase [Flavobacteriaceae bacterium]|nr:M23 family metallopeptidase [Flavobacteriaceae bacterium]